MALAMLLAIAECPDATAATSGHDGPASASAHASAPAPAPAPAVAGSAPFSVAETVAQIAADDDLQRAALARLDKTEPQQDLVRRTAALQADFDRLDLSRIEQADLVELVVLVHRAWVLKGMASNIVDDAASILHHLERDRIALEKEGRMWQGRLAFLRDRLVPVLVLDRARAVEADLQTTGDRVREVRDSALLGYVGAVTLKARIVETDARIAVRIEDVRARRAELEKSALWQLGAVRSQSERVASDIHRSSRVLRDYLADTGAQLAALFFSVLAVAWWLLRARPAREVAATHGDVRGQPVVASVLVALMALLWLAPSPPIAFYVTLLALAPIPAAILASRTFAANIPLTLCGLTFATVLLALRNMVEASPIADRTLLLLQAISLSVPLAIDLGRGRLQRAFPRWGADAVRLAAGFVIAAAAVSALHVFIGFSGPARSLRAGTGSIIGFGLVFGASAVALYGVVLALLARPPLAWLRSARAADPTLLRLVRMVLGVLAIGGVTFVTLGNLRLTEAALAAFDSLMGSTVEVGALSVPASAIAGALGIALTTLVVTAMTGFVLDREVFPRIKLLPGVGYAVATFTRWVMVIVGAVLSVAALGLDMTKVTLIGGALGVGIGFGLQNVVSNFVAGLILIVERPVSVGDLIEIGPLTGELRRIGIRSSSVKTTHGAEVIVPNSNLVSKEVINWTRSDRQRRYDIDVRVPYGCEPEQVMRLLQEAAMEVPEIMTNPAPRAVFEGFGESSLDFKLLAWVRTVDLGAEAQNALRVAVLGKLEGAAIVMPFKRREDQPRAVNAPAPAGMGPAPK